MSESIILVEGVGKKYRLRHQSKERYATLRDALAQKAKAIFNFTHSSQKVRKAAPCDEDFWALKDLNFEIKHGEVVGIIGHNGAGKSTLLKILSRITEPTAGRITLRGRVASLLEVGTGFHPELTGRENIFLNGAILGMTKAEIKGKFDEIVAFAEVERFLDTPVKRYSSGMYVRLAFAVAAHLEPEILIIDEVLAVGDAEFQKKCLGKMERVSKEGRTVLFVTHDMQSISTLTSRAILLDSGRVSLQGKTTDVISHYLSRNRESDACYTASPNPEEPNIVRVEVVTSEPGQVHVAGKPLKVSFEISTPKSIYGACLAFRVIDHRMRRIMHLWTFDSDLPMCRNAGRHLVVCNIPNSRLYMGRYSLQVYFTEPPGGVVFETLESICPFEVVMYGHSRLFPWQPDSCTYLEEGTWEACTL